MTDLASDPVPAADAGTERLRLYRYATVPEAADYVVIVRRFADALLAEWSASDLVASGIDLAVDVVEQRLRYLADNGNLMVSPREIRVSSIVEYQRQPARYSITSLGSRAHRHVEELLAAVGGAREVPRELAAAIAQRLTSLADIADHPARMGSADTAVLAEHATTVFLQFEDFAASVTDFYTYVGGVLTRADLEDDEWAGFKALLLDYLETIVENVTRHTPSIRTALVRLEPHFPGLVARLVSADPSLDALKAGPDGEGIGRARGRSLGDWAELTDWFSAGQGGVDQLRGAAGRAVGTLLANLKRINASSTREESMRRHFLRLAAWFDASASDDAHLLSASAFALYSARHIGYVLSPDVAEAVPANASWWRSPPAEVPVTLRERGNRAMLGRTARLRDHGAQRRRLAEEHRRLVERRQGAAAELVAAGWRLDEIRLSAAAMELLLEMLSRATADRAGNSTVSSGLPDDNDAELWLVDTPGDAMTITSEHGEFTVEARRVVVTLPGSSADQIRGRAAGDRRSSEAVS